MRAVTAGPSWDQDLSLQPFLSLPAVHMFSIPAGEGINQSVPGHVCGKNDPMLVNPSCIEVCPHLFPDCMQIHAHATHQFPCQPSKIGLSIIDGC